MLCQTEIPSKWWQYESNRMTLYCLFTCISVCFMFSVHLMQCKRCMWPCVLISYFQIMIWGKWMSYKILHASGNECTINLQLYIIRKRTLRLYWKAYWYVAWFVYLLEFRFILIDSYLSYRNFQRRFNKGYVSYEAYLRRNSASIYSWYCIIPRILGQVP